MAGNSLEKGNHAHFNQSVFKTFFISGLLLSQLMADPETGITTRTVGIVATVDQVTGGGTLTGPQVMIVAGARAG